MIHVVLICNPNWPQILVIISNRCHIIFISQILPVLLRNVIVTNIIILLNRLFIDFNRISCLYLLVVEHCVGRLF